MVLKDLDLTVFTLGGCSGLESTAVLKELISTVSTLGRYGSLERTEFNSFIFGRVQQS